MPYNVGDYIAFTAPSLFHDGGQSQHSGVVARSPRENPTKPRDRFYVVISGGKPMHVPESFVTGLAQGVPPAVDIQEQLARRDQFRFRRIKVPG